MNLLLVLLNYFCLLTLLFHGKVVVVAQPENDNCEDALPLSANTPLTGSTTGASVTGLDECGGSTNVEPDVWYTITGTGERMEANTCTGTSFDTKITVYSGACDSLTCVDADDDSCDPASRISWDSVDGLQYYVMVHGNQFADEQEGDFQVSVDGVTLPPTLPPGTNDACEDALGLNIGEALRGTTRGSTEDGAPECDGIAQTGPGVWYTVVGTGGDLFAGTCEYIDFDTRVNVYSGTCGNLTCVAADDDGCAEQSSEAFWASENNTVYYIMIHGPSDEVGEFDVIVNTESEIEIVNDFCWSAIPVQRDNLYFGSTRDATQDGFEPCDRKTSAPGLWYTIQGTGEDLTASLCFDLTEFDTRIAIYTGNCRNLNCVGFNNDACGADTSRIRWSTQIGRIYYIFVYGNTEDEFGTFQLEITGQQSTLPPDPKEPCFSSQATALVEYQGPTFIKDLQIGDNVLTKSGTYKPIYTIDHKHETREQTFLQIYTDLSRRPLEITNSHLVYLHDKKDPIMASDVKVGDQMQTVVLEGSTAAQYSNVTDIWSVTRKGLWNPITTDGTIVIDGIVTSTYSVHFSTADTGELQEMVEVFGFPIMSQHEFYHWLMLPYKALCLGISFSFCEVEQDGEFNAYSKIGTAVAKYYNEQSHFMKNMVGIVLFFVLCPLLLICSMRGLYSYFVKKNQNKKTKME